MDKIQQDLGPSSDKAYAVEQRRANNKYFSEERTGERPMSITIYKKSVPEVFAILKNIENFPEFFEHLKKIEMGADGLSQWHFHNSSDSPETAFSVPMTLSMEGNNLLVWKAETKAGFDYTVAIELLPAPANRGTVVRVMVAYDNFAGELASKIEMLFGKDAKVMAKKSLYRLRAFCETGHVPTTVGQPSGREEDLLPESKH